MKAICLSVNVHDIHSSMLKSAIWVLSLLPASHLFTEVWQNTEGSSQIVLGFITFSIFIALSIIGFIYALWASMLQLKTEADDEASPLEKQLVKFYRYMPMLSLMSIASYLATQF
ncbi:hypothetical protein [Acinetobacter larvae]|uniref:Uncharacterized protein n=1 Tax=Acinetobacter larvae TaxID=1789224 RepID=A0A1B2LW70_9GAMM|nr:hypothetical protein [Acinetobacter larvae]AOA57190.1 hypothetical protein BFG52_01695 [Acinetobacter larvae]